MSPGGRRPAFAIDCLPGGRCSVALAGRRELQQRYPPCLVPRKTRNRRRSRPGCRPDGYRRRRASGVGCGTRPGSINSRRFDSHRPRLSPRHERRGNARRVRGELRCLDARNTLLTALACYTRSSSAARCGRL